MMKSILWSVGLVLVWAMLIAGCTDLKTDLPAPTSIVPRVHDNGWADTAAVNFHGKYLKEKDWQTTNCIGCHGSRFDGGTSGTSCFSCHALYPHSVAFAGPGGHSAFMMDNAYPFSECKQCHGASYGGGSLGVSCLNSGCHVNPNGPEACNTCHGNFYGSASNEFSWAPPRSVRGDTLNTSSGVGAHQAHLADGEISILISCGQCHQVPTSVSAAGHLDSALPAEIRFSSSLAALSSAGHTLIPNPVYNYNTLRCSDTYCHGNWRLRRPTLPADTSMNFMYTDTVMTGSNYSPGWTSGDVEAQCGTCHGLPPAGHKDLVTPLSACYTCHYGAETMNLAKHVNGKVNIFGKEEDF